MSWVSFISGGISFMFAYFIFTAKRSENEDFEEDDLEVNDFKVRRKEISCQTCRKLKWHKEIEEDLWECVKCKRKIDLRKAS